MRRAETDPWAPAPTLSTEVRFEVAGVVARARVTQRFRNGTDGWVEGVYVFPLPERAAVDHLRMRVGERTIEGQIREREEARAEFQRAADSGRRASLVEQQRPNVFTSRVANLGPGEEVVVEIEFQQLLAFDEGEVRLRFPLVVGPRYVPGGRGPTPPRSTPPVRPPSEALHNPVKIEVRLDAGFPVDRVLSRTHAVLTEARGDSRFRVRLRDPLVPADRDFELAWVPQDGGPAPQRGLRGGAGRREVRAPHPLPADGDGRRGEPAPARGRLRDRHLRLDGGPLDPAGPPGAPARPRPAPPRRPLQRHPVQQHDGGSLPVVPARGTGGSRARAGLGVRPARRGRDGDESRPRGRPRRERRRRVSSARSSS